MCRDCGMGFFAEDAHKIGIFFVYCIFGFGFVEIGQCPIYVLTEHLIRHDTYVLIEYLIRHDTYLTKHNST